MPLHPHRHKWVMTFGKELDLPAVPDLALSAVSPVDSGSVAGLAAGSGVPHSAAPCTKLNSRTTPVNSTSALTFIMNLLLFYRVPEFGPVT